MANPGRVGGGLTPGRIPNIGGMSPAAIDAFINSPAFRNLPPNVQRQILDQAGMSGAPPSGGSPPPPPGNAPPGAPGDGGMIPRPGGDLSVPPGRQPPVIEIPNRPRDPEALPGAPARRGLPGPEAADDPRFPWGVAATGLGLLGLGAFAPAIIDYFDGEDPNLDAAAAPIAMEPEVGGAANALSARSEPGQNPNAPLISPRHRARINYWAERTGLLPTQVAGMFAQNPDEALAQLNLMASDRSQARRSEAADRWRATAMLAGGSQNINSGNRGAYNMLNELEGDERERALMYMSPAGPMAAAVDARNAQAAGEMASRAVQSMLANNMDPARQRLADAQIAEAERALPPAERAMKYRDGQQIHPSELDMVDQYVDANYSKDKFYLGFGNSTEFDLREQQATVDYLVNTLGYEPGKAQRIVDEMARRRHGSSSFGNPTRQ